MQRQLKSLCCSACHSESEACVYRQCTKELLCPACRRDPANRLVSQHQLLKKTLLTREDLSCLEVIRITNPKNPRFAKVKSHRLSAVLRLLLQKQLPVPEFLA